jgi:lysophospholipase L1-like esterase
VIVHNAIAILLVSSVALSATSPDVKQSSSSRPDWLDAMTRVQGKFTGRSGTFAHFGDSITVTLAFWAPLAEVRKNAPAEMERGYRLVQGYMQKECWRDWKGGRFGNEGTRTIRWAHENVDTWLKELNPETALIMFGTNDLNSVGQQEYQAKTRAVVQKCLDNGTVVILSTIPPLHDFAEKAAAYAQAVREIAHQMRVPLVDLHSEILKRRPEDWDGAMDEFAEYKDYDVPTLLARDGVHLSHPKPYQDDYSPEALDRCGYSLRNYLVLMKYVEVLNGLGRIRATFEGISDSGSGSSQEKAIQPPEQGWFPKAPLLPRPPGPTVEVSDVPQLIGAIREAKPGQTILVRDGHYMMPHYVQISADNVTLRGASGRRERVIIDGAQSRDGELLGVRACSGVTIADLTIQNVKWNGFKINSETNVQNLTIYNCIIHNIWQRGIKGVKVPEDNRDAIRPKQCRVQYCLFYNERPKRLSDDAADIAQGNYVGGIDVMYAKDWIISDNAFVGIQGRTYEGRGAIFIWHDSQDCVIERNIIIDCDVGLHLGNPHRPGDVQYHCVRFIARNNFITRAPEAGIVTVYTKDCKVLNNTIHDPQSRMGRLIRTVFANDGLVIANNLLNGPGIRNESESGIAFHNNLIGDFTRAFANPGGGDLHLNGTAVGAIDRGISMADVAEDIDGQHRESKPDTGADELMN